MVVFDAHFLMLALKQDPTCSVEKVEDRMQQLLEDLAEAKEKIIIPTPALSEFLVHADSATSDYMDQIRKSRYFKICPFGDRAAIEVALAIRSALTKKDKRGGSIDTWAKVKFDRQIVAIGKVEGAHTIYTDDKGVTNFASQMGIKVLHLADLSLPPVPPQKPLPFESDANNTAML